MTTPPKGPLHHDRIVSSVPHKSHKKPIRVEKRIPPVTGTTAPTTPSK